MSSAGTPSTDPWVILAKERNRYEEQFRALNPQNGVVTGEQAKGFLLQSQLPPLVLGQIWGLADTDADGKMDLNEFSIACKLINLKLRGFEIPKVLPPNLIASLQMHTAPAIPPLPNPALINAPPRPEPPKIPPQPVNIPTGIIPPMQSNVLPSMLPMQPLLHQQPLLQSTISQQPLIQSALPPQPLLMQSNIQSQPLIQSTITQQPLLQSTVQPLNQTTQPINMPPVGVIGGVPNVAPIISGTQIPSLTGTPVNAATSIIPPATNIQPLIPGPGATSTPRTSITSLDKNLDQGQPEWSVPHHTKLKYTQVFNTTDRTRSGYLTGPQARNIMVQTKLPQNILAQIWALSDMDSDGRLGSEEFVLAMHLCEQAALGIIPPTVLPLELIPPSFRRVTRTVSRTASVSSQGSGQPDVDLTLISQNSFEDKRKENFDKGQAELERRRKALLDQQRKEAEERERKEREEIEKREKARLEVEKKRVEELEKQMREQQERELQIEEERKRQSEQREAARKEMERQRQLEWEKQRLQELQQQRQREQENVLKLKAKNQTLTIELGSLNDQVKELSQKICDTRVGVSNVKTTIDGMRTTRDVSMQEMAQYKNKLKEQNAKLLQLSQEKSRMDAKNKLNSQMNEQAKQAFENKEITIKNLKEKVESMEEEINSKMSDIENNNSQLTDLKTELNKLIDQCEQIYLVYEQKKTTVLSMKGTRTTDYSASWGNDTSWKDSSQKDEWPVDNWAQNDVTTEPAVPAGTVKYRALYEFVARNNDEISFQPGDIINVPLEQTGEPGWLAGEIRGHTGWFPESYVESLEGAIVHGADSAIKDIVPDNTFIEDADNKRLELIAEVPETSIEPEPVAINTTDVKPEYYLASYPYQSVEQGDLTFNAGEMVEVIKKEGEWWTGRIGDRTGIFPSNYVQKAEDSKPANIETPVVSKTIEPLITNEAQESQMDNEISQINENKELEKTDFSALASNAQTIKGGKKPEIASVIAPYQATSPEQLSLERGQLIMIRKKTDSGWWEGELQAKGRKRQVGWFPASYVKVLNSSGRASGRTTPVSTTRIQQEVIIDKVVALYPYTAANPDELSFLKDDIISVTARDEAAWWQGELNGVSGLFPSNYVTPLQQCWEEMYNKKRNDCIEELIQTEKAYIDDMSVVHRVFEIPLIESKVVNESEISKIFVNWQDILFCNREFLKDLLEAHSSSSDTVGYIVCKHLPRMTAYVAFCKKQLDSAALLQNLYESSSPFREVVRKCQSDPATRGMPLSSFLIKPMQRITKYPLLIGKILDNTPDNHPDYPYLKEAQQVADNFLKSINENVRQKEDSERLEWLQVNVQNDLNIIFNGNTNKLGSRKLLHYGILNKVKSGKDLLGFLFNDFLLFVQPNKPLTGQFNFPRGNNILYKMYKQPMLIQELKASRGVLEGVDNNGEVNKVLKLQDNKVFLALLTSSVNECNLWLKKIEAAKEIYDRAISLTRPKPKTKAMGITRGRLLVHVQKGKRLVNSGRSNFQNVYCRVQLGNIVQNTNVAIDGSNGNVPGNHQIPTLIWNYSMQFPLKDMKDDSLIFTVLEMCPFNPDEFLGSAELRLFELYEEHKRRQVNGPIVKKLILHKVESGEITIKFDLQLYNNY